MPGQAREMLLLALSHHFISEKEFLFSFDASFSKNPSFPYEDYDRFDLDARDETDFLHRFRVRKMDISRLAHALMILRVCAAINDMIKSRPDRGIVHVAKKIYVPVLVERYHPPNRTSSA